MAKYAIKKEFFPFNHFKPPINKPFLWLARTFMKTPKCLYKDVKLDVNRYNIRSYDGKKIKCLLISPKVTREKSPCLIYIHGGGFVLLAAKYHYQNAMRYAKEAGCKVWFVNYRLAPKHPHPTFFEDCYTAMRYLYENAATLGIDKEKIGIGGDSAGATLSVGTILMARDHHYPIRFAFQMLVYPFLDMRGTSEANQKYTDTPMWNSSLSTKIDAMTKVDRNNPLYVYYSPVEAEHFKWFPPAYIETAEFDCLHDDGILYAKLLQEEGIPVEVNETSGTMHGFDIKQNAQTTKEALSARVEFMRKMFK